MKEYKIVAPCHFGMEAVLKREIQNLGYNDTTSPTTPYGGESTIMWS